MTDDEIAAQNRRSGAFYDKAIIALVTEGLKGMTDITTDLAGQESLRAPVKTGHLRASGVAMPPELVQRGGAAIIKGEVRVPVPYAAIQHDNTSFKHPMGGEDHYLSKPLHERIGMYRDYIQKRVTAAFKTANRQV